MINRKNALKISVVFVVLALALGVLFMGPMAEQPDPGVDVQTPSMQNIPEGTQLRLEVERPPEEADEAPETP